jgi:glycosyltransferase involved in cell wall biosynthesis
MPFVYKNSTKVTVSQSSRTDMESVGISDASDTEIVHPGIDVAKFKNGKKSKHPSLLYLGRLKPYKSIDTIIKAMPAVLKQNPHTKLNIAGFGESRKSLIQLANRLGVNKSVKFLGKVSEEKKVQLLTSSWVFVYPSTMEGWGIAAMEASASGTAVIASNTKGLKDSVSNLKTGILVETKNPSQLAEKINLLLNDALLRNSLAKNGLEWSKNFTWDKSSRQFLQILTNEVERKTARLKKLAYTTN